MLLSNPAVRSTHRHVSMDPEAIWYISPISPEAILTLEDNHCCEW